MHPIAKALGRGLCIPPSFRLTQYSPLNFTRGFHTTSHLPKSKWKWYLIGASIGGLFLDSYAENSNPVNEAQTVQKTAPTTAHTPQTILSVGYSGLIADYETLEKKIEVILEGLESSGRGFEKSNLVRNLQRIRETKKQLLEQRAPTIVLVGRAQQGKSSLINCMAGRCLGRIGDILAPEHTIPGKFSVPRRIDLQDNTGISKLIFIDTRGWAEPVAHSTENTQNMVEDLLRFLNYAPPNFVFYVRDATMVNSDTTVFDLQQLDSFCATFKKNFGCKVPVHVVLSKVEMLDPVMLSPDTTLAKEKLGKAKNLLRKQFQEFVDPSNAALEDIIGVRLAIACTEENYDKKASPSSGMQSVDVSALQELLFTEDFATALTLSRTSQFSGIRRTTCQEVVNVLSSTVTETSRYFGVADPILIWTAARAMVGTLCYITGEEQGWASKFFTQNSATFEALIHALPPYTSSVVASFLSCVPVVSRFASVQNMKDKAKQQYIRVMKHIGSKAIGELLPEP